MSSSVHRLRRRYVVAAVLTVVAGLTSRRTAGIPAWIGDLLWAALLFFVLSVVFPAARRGTRAAAALAMSYLVEISQLYQADSIVELRRNTLVHLFFGASFSWLDIAAYTAGTAVAAAVDLPLRRLPQDGHDSSTA